MDAASPTLFDRLHAFLTDTLHVSPKIADPAIAAAIAVVTNWIVTGSFDVGAVKLAALGLLLAIVGYVAPVATSLTPDGQPVRLKMRELGRASPRSARRRARGK